MNKVITLLGLAATATEDEVVSKVQAYLNRVKELEPLAGQLTTLNTEHTALKNRHDALLTSSVEKTLTEYSGVITEQSKHAWTNRLKADYTGTLDLLKGIKPAVAAKPPVHKGGRTVDVTVTGEQVAHPFLNRVSELQAADAKLSEGDAILRAATEKPSLYDDYRTSLQRSE